MAERKKMSFKFEKLDVWKEAVAFVSDIYKLTKEFPRSEQYGLTSQLNRAVVSISLNIAEGQGRNSDIDFARFIQFSIGSLNEVVTILYIALDQKYLNDETYKTLNMKCEKISKMLHSFRNTLKKKQ